MRARQSLHRRAAEARGARGTRQEPAATPKAAEGTGAPASASVFSTSPIPETPLTLPRRLRLTNWRLVWQLLLVGLCMEICYLALYAVLMRPTVKHDPLLEAWQVRLPKLARVYQLIDVPVQRLTQFPWLNMGAAHGYANIALLVLGIALLGTVLAGWIGRRAERMQISSRGRNGLLRVILLVTVVFGITFVCAPIALSPWTSDMLQSWLLGRMVIVQHVNPYAVDPTLFNKDSALQMLQVLSGGNATSGGLQTFGPVRADVAILLTQARPDNIVLFVLSTRVLDLVACLLSAWLIWAILAKVRPAWQISGTVLFAWNPLVLLVSVGQGHTEILLVMLVLLAAFFLAHSAPLLGWCLVLLAALFDLSALLLLPLFLRALVVEARYLGRFLKLGWWLSLFLLSGVMLLLAYLPFWQGWGIFGVLESVRQAFWQEQTINSLLAALQSLLPHPPANLSWLLAPQIWLSVLLVLLFCGLIFSLWLINELDLLLACASGLLLVLVIGRPGYWPWFLLLPLALALCSSGRSIRVLALLLAGGGILSFYCALWQVVWVGQGLLTIGVPCLIWGWFLFFNTLWQMMRGRRGLEEEEEADSIGRPHRPPWYSRPWPSRPGRRR